MEEEEGSSEEVKETPIKQKSRSPSPKKPKSARKSPAARTPKQPSAKPSARKPKVSARKESDEEEQDIVESRKMAQLEEIEEED